MKTKNPFNHNFLFMLAGFLGGTMGTISAFGYHPFAGLFIIGVVFGVGGYVSAVLNLPKEPGVDPL